MKKEINIQNDMKKYDIPPDPNKKFPSAMYWMNVLVRRAFRDAGNDNYEEASEKWFKENEPLIHAHMDQYVTEIQMKPERFGANGFWHDKDNGLKTVVWALDRKIWPLVFAEEATHSWGRQESAKLILEYIDQLQNVPSDEEIEKAALEAHPQHYQTEKILRGGFIQGARWMRDYKQK